MSDWSWLRADDWRACVADPDALPSRIREHLDAENAAADAWFSSSAQLMATIETELRGRIQPVEDSLPEFHGPWAYFERYREDDEYGQYLRRPREGGDEAVLLDVDLEAEGHDYFDEGDVEHSLDHRYLAWLADVSGDERYTLHVRDLETGQDILTIEDTNEVVWGTPDTLFFTRVDEELRPTQVYRLRLGDEPVLIFEETDPRFYVSVGGFRSDRWIYICSQMTDCTEMHLIPTNDITAKPVVVEPRTEGLEYDLNHQGDRFVIITNADGAADYKLMEAPVDTPGREHWKEIDPHRPGRTLMDVDALGDWLTIVESENALLRCRVQHRDGTERILAFDEEAYDIEIDGGREPDTDRFRLAYSSPTTPEQTFDEVLATGERILLKEQKLPSGHNPADYVTRRVMMPSHDGVQVPVTLLHHRDTALDGTAPALLHGYGSYGMSVYAHFRGSVLSLIDRGFVLAIAHVRGGLELGRAWYESGRLEHKKNSFEDFYAVAQQLVEQGIAARGRIVLEGGSAGGLLVAATTDLVVRRDPGLLAGVVADVPFVDVLTTMSDATLPQTPGEWSEWGDPITDDQARAYIASYSPVDQVGAYAYPPMYVTAGISDPRVTWWEPARWVARLRESRTNDAPLLLRTNMESGHFGETGRYGSLADTAREYAFVLRVVGMG